MKTTLAVIVALLTLTSCSIQKRMYSPGYNFIWNTNKHNTPTHNTTAANNNQIAETTHYDSLVIDDYVASTDTKIIIAKTEKISLTTVKKTKLNTFKNVVTKLDTINGTELLYQRDAQTNTSNKINYEAAIPSAISALAGLLLFHLGLYFVVVDGILTALVLYVLAVTGLIIGLAAGLLGLFSLVKIISNHKKYKGYVPSIIAILSSIILFLYFLSFITTL
ncbi:MAG: hypothetical protein ABL940_00120 [Bacteroidia bacterium]